MMYLGAAVSCGPDDTVALADAEPRIPDERRLGLGLLLAGVVGLAAAFVLTVEKIALLRDPGYRPSCSLNPVLSCGSIMESDQAELFGFPNPLLGLVGFALLAATGAGLCAGARYGRAYWLGLQAGVTLGAALVVWLIFQSLYRINALCPYCMAVWAVVLPTFWYVSLRNASQGVLGARAAFSSAVRVAREWHLVVVTAALLVVVVLIAEQFWTYWGTLV